MPEIPPEPIGKIFEMQTLSVGIGKLANRPGNDPNNFQNYEIAIVFPGKYVI